MPYKKRLILITMAMCTCVCMAQQSLNNDNIVKMHAAGMGDDIIVSIINSQPGIYSSGADALIALKTAGISDKVIGAMIAKSSTVTSPTAETANTASGTPATAQPNNQTPAPIVQTPAEPHPPVLSVRNPRVFLTAVSKGNTNAAGRDQSMEMSKDFEKDCPGVKISIIQQAADYTVLLNHIEIGWTRDNQIQIADKDGDLISKTKEGGSIDGNVKKACEIILADWNKK